MAVVTHHRKPRPRTSAGRRRRIPRPLASGAAVVVGLAGAFLVARAFSFERT